MNKISQLLAGTLVFIFLFYHLAPGLNVSIFGIAVWFLPFLAKRKKPANRHFWALSFACWISIFSFAWYGDEISFLALFSSLVMTTFYSQYPTMNIITYPAIFIINLLTFPFRVFFFKYWLPGNLLNSGWKKWLSTAVIPVLFLVLFSIVYATGSNIFSDFFKNIFFKFSVAEVFVLAVVSFFILFNLWCLWVPKLLIMLNKELSNNFATIPVKSIIPTFSVFDKNLEKRGGEITFTLLNVLLFIFIIAYNYEQFFETAGNNSLSDEIHQRVATVIISILMAIGLILFYFKSKIDVENEGRFLKKLTLIWISLNSLLVLSAFLKNGEYILHYGLTFKRISVFIFLIICLIGLYLTWHKIKYQKTNFFLINRMTWTLFITIVLVSPVNFSWIVTKYNISVNKGIEKSYLQGLDYNKSILSHYYSNIPEWSDYFLQEQKQISLEKRKPLLSSNLYYRFFRLSKQ